VTRGALGIAGIAVALVLPIGGCGDESSSQPPTGPLAAALATIGGGGAHGSLGVGWADPQLVRRSGAGPGLMADALGPNAGSVIEATPRLRRRFDVDPSAAESLVSVGGSYAFGLRLEGIDGRRLGRSLVAAGGRAHQRGRLRMIEVGDYAVVPDPLLRAGVHGLGAFDAFGPGMAVLAISDRARATLLGRGGRLLDQPVYGAAADCLGDVIAARMIPDKHLLSNEQGVDLVAVGVSPEAEVLCVLGGTAERSADVAAALETSLAPTARDPVSGEPIGDSLTGVEVRKRTYEEVEVVRAEATPAAGQGRGLFFDAIARGSLVALINGSPRTFMR
jgi:hypothetical protein